MNPLNLLKTSQEGEKLSFRTLVIRTTPNNLMITTLNENNQVVNWSSKGYSRLKGQGKKKLDWRTFRKRIQPNIRWFKKHKTAVRTLIFKGPVPFLKKTLQLFHVRRVPIFFIRIEKSIPHNGCKLPKLPRK